MAKVVERFLSEKRIQHLIETQNSFAGESAYALEQMPSEDLRSCYKSLFDELREVITAEANFLSEQQ